MYIIKKQLQISAPNEGCAVSVGIGCIHKVKNTSYLHAKFRIRKCYKSSLTSLCVSKFISIPLLILIGWRGANIKDAPQHTMVGETILRQLKLFKIKNVTLKTDKRFKKKISKLINFAKK